jgi:prevent-host-death family protein
MLHSNPYLGELTQVNIHQAKTQLSRLLERVAAGEEIVIVKSRKPLAKLVPFREVVWQPGRLKGKIKIGHDFAAPLPDAFAAASRSRVGPLTPVRSRQYQRG